jgi:16S rRNA (guanine527-N7)-methyltransferase
MDAPSLEPLLRDRARNHGVVLPDLLIPKLLAYYSLLARWNARMNLTSLTDPVQAIDRLLLEPVKAGQNVPAGRGLVDLGSGGGSPAIPLALACGARSLLMIESKARKAAFLREAVRHVGLVAAVECARFEDVLPRLRKSADLVSMRAVRVDEEVLTLVHAALAPGGEALLFLSNPADLAPAPGLKVDRTIVLLPTLGSRAVFLKAGK